MVATKYKYKYKVEAERDGVKIDQKFKSVKDLLEVTKEPPFFLSSRSSLYNVMNCVGKNYRYMGIKVYKIDEPIPVKKKLIVQIISDDDK
jgi:hypothetical protein